MSNNKELQLVTTTDNIKDKIYTIRGVQVMLDSDLARLYEVETGALNRQVKRNIERFPSDFMFQLSKKEYENLKCQIGITSSISYGGRRSMPYVFTEQGVSSLSGVIHTEVSIKMNISIMRAFVAMRHYLSENALVFQRLNNIELKQIKTDERVDVLFNRLEQHKEVKAVMFFKGQMYDASTLIKKTFLKVARRNLSRLPTVIGIIYFHILYIILKLIPLH